MEKLYRGDRAEFDAELEDEPELRPWNDGRPAPGKMLRSARVYRKPSTSGPFKTTRDLAGVLSVAARDAGRPLPASVRETLEPLIGSDLHTVRVHVGDAAARASDALSAEAFTFGQDIYFARGKYDPASPVGRELIAHEVVHTLQQRDPSTRLGDVSGNTLELSEPGDAHESAADRIAARAMSAESASAQAIPTAESIAPSLTGVVARRTSPTAPVPTPTSSVAEAWNSHLASWAEAAKQTSTLGLTAKGPIAVEVSAGERSYAMRVFLLLSEEDEPETFDDIKVLLDQHQKIAKQETLTLTLLRLTMTDTDPLYFQPEAFPGTWSRKVRKEMKLPSELDGARAEKADTWREVQKLGADLPPYVFAHGLPVDFQPALTLARFDLQPAHATMAHRHAIKPYTAKMLEYQKAYGKAYMAMRWEAGIRALAGDLAAGRKVVDTTTYTEFVFNNVFSFSLYQLLTRADQVSTVDMIAQPYVDLMPYQIAMAKTLPLVARLEELAMWSKAKSDWHKWLSFGDDRIAATGKGKKLLLAKDWAWEWGYFGDSVSQTIDQLITSLPESAAYGAGFTLAMFIPIVREVTIAVTAISAGYEAVKAIKDVHSAWSQVAHARSVVDLQRGSAQAAMMTVSGGATALAAIAKYKAGKMMAKRVPTRGKQRFWRPNAPPSPRKRGMTRAHDRSFRRMAQNEQKIIIVRDSNKAAGKYVGKKNFLPKPETLKAKTRLTPPNKGLAAVDPSDPRLMSMLREKRMTYTQYVKQLDREGYTVAGPADGFIVKRGRNAYHSDYDLHGVYNKYGENVYSARWARHANEKLLKRNKHRATATRGPDGKIRDSPELIQHGPHDMWDERNRRAAGPNRGPQPPATAYMPDGRAVHLKTIADMKKFYRQHNIDWAAIYPRH